MSSHAAMQLQELERLHAEGVISDEEFSAAQARIAGTLLSQAVANPERDRSTIAAIMSRTHTKNSMATTTATDRRVEGLPPLKTRIKLSSFLLLILGLMALNSILNSGQGATGNNAGSRDQLGLVDTQFAGSDLTSGPNSVVAPMTSDLPVNGLTSTGTSIPHRTADELLKLVDGHWAAADWTGIVELLRNDLVADGDPVLREKLYAALINQGQSAMDSGRVDDAQLAFSSALDLDAERGIAQMQNYAGDGSARVAVSQVIAQSTFHTGYSTVRLNNPDRDQFLLVSVAVENNSEEVIHANPLNFTLVTEGYTMNPDENLYSMSNYFDATDLQPGAYTMGWLLFIAPKSETYTLVYQSWYDDAIRKLIVVTEQDQ